MPFRAPSRLALAVASLHPIAGGLSADERARRSLRLVTVLVAVLVPLFGVVLHLTAPGAVDPWEGRAAWTLAALGTLGLSYVWGPVRRHASRVLTLVAYGVIAYFAALAYLNGLHPSYAMGYLFVYVSAAMVYCFAFNRIGPLALCVPVSIGAAAAVAVAVPEPRMNPVVFVLYAACLGVIILLAVLVRLRAEQELAHSEASLAEAERLASVGHWTHDLRSGARRWSAGLYRLAGLVPRPGPPPDLFDFAHPDDLPLVRRCLATLSGREDTLDHRFRLVRPDGDVRTIHLTVRVYHDRAGLIYRCYGAVVDVTEQAEREATLERARAAAEEARLAAEEAARLKASILANMSHEIRTPITAVLGYAQVLGEEVAEEHRELVEPIERGGRRLLDTLNSVLDLARLEAGGPALTCQPTDVVAEAEEVARLLHGRAAAKGVALRVETPGPVLALADGSALHRVLMNLVGNAVKFTERGEVVVRVHTDHRHTRIHVADTGRGITAAFLPRLFDAFRQESHGDGRSHEGSGLGLAITRRLVEAMGGEVGAESVHGRGSVFTVALPAAPAAPGVRAAYREMPAWTSAAPALA